jgi:50S ribosomal protein L16 3-hydroxylase
MARMTPTLIPTLLGGLTAEEFLADYWQKKPLLVRGAVPGFTGVPGLGGRDDMLALAARDDVESRFVSQAEGWTLEHGPFNPAALKRRKKPWTVLAQGVNLVNADGERLMRAFDFIPYARLDDLMVSYATDGGGVGPHFDSYDVFLLQGIGQRRWRIGKQKDQTLIDGLPVRILADFHPTHDWVLGPGDLLYLPPEWAHDGIAVGECMTWSIGFRAFPAQELAEQFLMHLQDNVCLDGRYRDPDLRRQKHPAEIGGAMIDQVEEILARIPAGRDAVRDFLGCMLTEPKPHVFFDAPEKPLAPARFAAAAAKRGVRLDARTQLLFSGAQFFINGERVQIPAADRAALRQLADHRALDSIGGLSVPGLTLLREWYLCGFLAVR